MKQQTLPTLTIFPGEEKNRSEKFEKTFYFLEFLGKHPQKWEQLWEEFSDFIVFQNSIKEKDLEEYSKKESNLEALKIWGLRWLEKTQNKHDSYDPKIKELSRKKKHTNVNKLGSLSGTYFWIGNLRRKQSLEALCHFINVDIKRLKQEEKNEENLKQFKVSMNFYDFQDLKKEGIDICEDLEFSPKKNMLPGMYLISRENKGVVINFKEQEQKNNWEGFLEFDPKAIFSKKTPIKFFASREFYRDNFNSISFWMFIFLRCLLSKDFSTFFSILAAVTGLISFFKK